MKENVELIKIILESEEGKMWFRDYLRDNLTVYTDSNQFTKSINIKFNHFPIFKINFESNISSTSF